MYSENYNLEQQLKDALREISELRRDAQKYRNGILTFEVEDDATLNKMMYPEGEKSLYVKPTILEVAFYMTDMNVDFPNRGRIQRKVSGLIKVIGVKKGESTFPSIP